MAWARYDIVTGLLLLRGSKPDLPKPRRIEHPDRPEPGEAKREIVSDPDEIAKFFGLVRKEVSK